MNPIIPNLLGGAIAMGCAVIGLCFLKFWRRTRDPFFGYFALAFFLMGFGRIVEAIMRNEQASTPSVYVFRLIAYSIIIFAILQKNMAGRK